MSTTFPFTSCCQLLGVDPKTLRHWLWEAGIGPTSPSTDSRLKLLTLQQLYHLAVLYRRPITPATDAGREGPPEATPLSVHEPSPSLWRRDGSAEAATGSTGGQTYQRVRSPDPAHMASDPATADGPCRALASSSGEQTA